MPYLCNHQPASLVHKIAADFYLFKLAHSTRVLGCSLLPPRVSSVIRLANVPSFGCRSGTGRMQSCPLSLCTVAPRLSRVMEGHVFFSLQNNPPIRRLRETFGRLSAMISPEKKKTTDRKKRCLNKKCVQFN